MIVDLGERLSILQQYGRTPSGVSRPLLGDFPNILFHRIEKKYYEDAEFNIESIIHPTDLENPEARFLLTPEYQRGYIHFKYVVAKVLRPESIIEIGVGAGNSAIAFKLAAPKASYLGIDNNSKSVEFGINYEEHIKKILYSSQIFKCDFWIMDSMSLNANLLPKGDLFHVDGAHDYEHAYNDVLLAFESKAKYILVDDAHDKQVVKASMDVAYKYEGVAWRFFEDTFTGNLLFIRTGGVS